ncbi:MAG TPA: MarR family transcriptional regulator [Xanthobacteraceae bacterium]|nr:MarR family transcriptional regulator [Xanthobacteraceae bacterium]
MPFVQRDFVFALSDVARLLRTYADQEARRYGLTRAQWAVLARLETCEGLKQAELAELLDIQPITLTRLIDRLCDSGLIERRPDPTDRRVKRLHLTPAATPLLAGLADLGRELFSVALSDTEPDEIAETMRLFARMKDNLRGAIQTGKTRTPSETTEHHD